MRLLLLMLVILSPATFAQGRSDAICDTLTKYKKINNQTATYQPGVDVNGNAVVPADINTPPVVFQNVTKVPLTVDLAQRLSSLQGTGIEMKNNFELLSIHPDGRVTFGDEDLTSDIKTVCGIPHEVVKEPVVETPMMEKPKAVEVKKVEAVPPKEPVTAPTKPQVQKKVVTETNETKPEVKTKIITHWPELIPDKIQGGDYRE